MLLNNSYNNIFVFDYSELSMDYFNTLSISYKHTEDVHKEGNTSFFFFLFSQTARQGF